MKILPLNGEVKHKRISWTCQAWLARPPGESLFMPSCFPSLRAKGKWFHSCSWIQRSTVVPIYPTLSTLRCIWAWQTVGCVTLTGSLPEAHQKIQILFAHFKCFPLITNYTVLFSPPNFQSSFLATKPSLSSLKDVILALL